jgi:hypothetical protein
VRPHVKELFGKSYINSCGGLATQTGTLVVFDLSGLPINFSFYFSIITII